MSRYFTSGARTWLSRLSIGLASIVVASAISVGSASAADKTTEEQELQKKADLLKSEVNALDKKIKALRSQEKSLQRESKRLKSDLQKAKAEGGKGPVAEKKTTDLEDSIAEKDESLAKVGTDIANNVKIQRDKDLDLKDTRKQIDTIKSEQKRARSRRSRDVSRIKQAKTKEVAVEERRRKSDDEIRLENRLMVAGITLPQDLQKELQYVWSLPFDEAISPNQVWVTERIVLVLVSDRVLYCVRASDGVPMWAVELDSPPQFEPAISEKNVYVFVKNSLTAIDITAGQIIWQVDPSFAPAAAPCVSEPNLYIPAWDKRLYALEVQSRERLYLVGSEDDDALKSREYSFRYSWHKTTKGHVVSTPTLAEGFLYFGSEDGYVYSVSVDGEDRYKTQTQGPVRSPATARATGLYVGSSDFNAYGLNRLTGQVRWIFPTGSDVLRSIYADPGAGIAIVASSKNGIYGISDRLGATLGKQLWYIPDGEYVAGVNNERAFIVLSDRRLAAVEKTTGHVQWMSLLDGIKEIVPSQTNWTEQRDRMRLICISASGRHMICLKEPKEGLRRAIAGQQ